MNRRTALKNLTATIGYAVATPSIMSILASCKETSNASWSPVFLSHEEQHVITLITDIILPSNDIPGALDVNITQFIDMMYQDIETDHKKNIFKKGASLFASSFANTFNKPISKSNKSEITTLLTKYFSLSEKDEKQLFNQQKKNANAISENEKENYFIYKFLLSVREYTIFGYCTSEKVGKEVLAYDPIPGEYNGDITTQKATNGRAWSL